MIQSALTLCMIIFTITSPVINAQVPANVYGAWLSSSTVSARCDAITGATYTASLKNTNNTAAAALTGTGGALPVAVSAVLECVVYELTMTSTIAGATSAASSAFTFATTTRPATPTNFNAAAVAGDSMIEANWTAVANPPTGCTTYYRLLFVSSNQTVEYSVFGATTFKTPKLLAKTAYSVSLQAVTIPGNVGSFYTSAVAVTTNAGNYLNYQLANLGVLLALSVMMTKHS